MRFFDREYHEQLKREGHNPFTCVVLALPFFPWLLVAVVTGVVLGLAKAWLR